MAATIDNRVAELERANAQLRRQLDACSAELKEARDQQTATAEVLQVINSSPGDLAPVFDTTLEKALRLCDAAFGILFIRDGELFRAAATLGLPAPLEDFMRNRFKPDQVPLIAGAIQQGQVLHVHDLADSDGYRQRLPSRIAGVELGGARTVLYVPLTKDGRVLGVFVIFRQEVRPFSDKQITLVQNFATQAVIAMENGRLLKELQQRTGDLQESLEYQTATSDVLKVISRSTFDLQPVLETLLETAARLCGADKGGLNLREGEVYRVVATFAQTPEYDEFIRGRLSPTGRGGMTGRVALRGEVVHVADIASDPEFTLTEAVTLGKARTMLGVPLLRDGIVVGTIALWRIRVQPFTDRQIELVRTFADQAVIALENARLLTETREALEQQTATAEVLQVINSSPGDLAPVFDAMLENATRLCDGVNGILWTIDGKRARLAASRNMPSAIVELLRRQGEAGEHPMVQRVIAGEHLFQFDLADHDVYRSGEVAAAPHVVAAGVRTIIWVAMVKDGAAVGAFVISRNEIRPVTEKQIALLQNFGAQAVIAMESARLITETREALEQQTATAEVLQVINSAPGDLAPVFDAMLEKAVRLCDFAFAALWTYDGTQFHPVALHAVPKPFEAFMREHVPPAFERLVRGGGPMHFADIMATEIAQRNPAFARAAQELAGVRTLLLVPLRKDDALLGVFVAYRQEVRPFTDKQIALLENFAAQAVIAMENARLLTATREALEQQTATAEVLQVINSSPGDLAPVFDAMLEKAMRLCEAAFGFLLINQAGHFRFGAGRGLAVPLEEYLRELDFQPGAGTTHARLLEGASFVHVSDIKDDEPYRSGNPVRLALVDIGGARTALVVSLRKENAVLGAFTIYRQEVRPFSDKEIALLENFAAQAVIAMENARLLTETREALEQQTATAEVLQVINSSPGDLTPVFDAMLDRAMRLCGVDHAALELYDGEQMHAVAVHGASGKFSEMLRQGYPATESPASRTLLEGGSFVEIADAAEIDHVAFRTAAAVDGIRTVLFVPLQRDDVFLGMIGSARREVRPFSEKEIALLQNFAAQAVIAMENARLITETREALEQQTATAEVLQVINSSPGDLAPVFDAILEKAHSLCGAVHGALATYDGEHFRAVATHGVPEPLEGLLRTPFRPEPGSPHELLLGGQRLIHIADQAAQEQTNPIGRASVEIAGTRTLLFIPLRKDDALLGYISAFRPEVRPFSDKQITLLQNFAAQAVIAMENARLLTETREALEQQTATAEVLQVINSSPGDLAPVFDAMIQRTLRLSDASCASLAIFDGERFDTVVSCGHAEFDAWIHQFGPIQPGPGSTMARMLNGEHVAQVVDITADADVAASNPVRRALIEIGGFHTLIGVDLRKDDRLLGCLHVYRREVRPFTDKQIALLQNFAAQAVIAIENARLITETREALEQQTATAEVLQVINSSPGDLAPVFDAMLDKAMRLCEAAHGHLYIYDGDLVRPTAVRGERRFTEWMRQTGAYRPAVGSVAERVFNGHVVHIPNAFEHESYRTVPRFREVVEVSGCASLLSVPLRKGDTVLGAINVYRREIRPFTDKQIALLQNFAAQAVIAMENARLLAETREALQRYSLVTQAAGEGVYEWDIERDAVSASPRLIEIFGLPDTGFTTADWRQLVHAEDLPSYRAAMRDCLRGTSARLHCEYRVRHQSCEYRWIEDSALPVRNEVGRAVRLIGAVTDITDRKRSEAEIREALEQQTATAEVLQVINSSPGDLAPVFEAVLDKATTLCDAAFGILWTYDGERFRPVAFNRMPPAFADFMREHQREGFYGDPRSPGGLGAMVRGEPFAQALDTREGQLYRTGRTPLTRAFVELGGARSGLIVPLRKEGKLLGAIRLFRQEVRPFTDKQIALLQNFAAQAVIAMENARLLTETREALEQQTATAEVLQVINFSPGNLAPVFDAMLEKATRLCDAASGILWTYDGVRFRAAAQHGLPDELIAELQTDPIPTASLQKIAAGEDVVRDDDLSKNRGAERVVEEGGMRTGFLVALRKGDLLLGAIRIHRREARPFSDKQIALVQNFAAQAVIAMENARLLTETREALEQQTATAEVLGVINSSPGDLEPVYAAILEKAHNLCGIAVGTLQLYDGAKVRTVAQRGVMGRFAELLREPYELVPGHPASRLLGGERIVHIIDHGIGELAKQQPDNPRAQASAQQGLRTALWVPLRKDAELLGYISAFRQEVRPFSEKEIALLENFAAQAVIAMENARLLTETREALEQQTATAEVLQVINSSPGDLAPVFDAILEKAHTLCGAAHGGLNIYEGERFRNVAAHAMPPRFAELMRRPFHARPIQQRLLRGERYVHVPDMMTIPREDPDDPIGRASDEAGIRTLLVVPLRKDGALLGYITAHREVVRPFSEKQIALLENFAAQAVIAMENARLLTETREALEQQTATAKVLQVINSSPGDLAPVFDAMLEKAMHLCDAGFGTLWTYDGAYVHAAALYNVPPIFAEFLARAPHPVGPDSAHGRLLRGEAVVHISDIVAEEAYRLGDPIRRALVELGGGRALLAVPLRKDDAFLGDFVIYRQEARPFSEKQIVLLQNFAAQAVIAMENARLLRELRQRTGDLQESLEYQTAISDVLRVMSGSAFDLDPVLQTVVTTAVRLCRADSATIYRNVDGEYRWAAGHMLSPEYEEIERDVRIRPGTGTLVGRVAAAQQTVQILDAWTDPLYEVTGDARIGGVHSMLGVPLLREGVPIGVIGLARRRVEAFTERESALVTTFADQAVIAIENARLLNDLQQRTSDLQESLEYQTATSDVLKVISQTSADLDRILETLVETAARICQADKAVLQQLRDGVYRMGASFGFTQEFEDYRARNPIKLDRGTPIGRMALERRVVHVEDSLQDPEFTDAVSRTLGGFRTMLAVPLFREDAVIGGLFLARSRVEPFTEKQIALVTTFADQAVIAIENARLFNELRDRTEELGRSVEELRALNEIAQAVSSTLDLRAVLSTVLTRSVGLSEADAGAVFRYSRAERLFRLVEAFGWDEALLRSVGDLRIAAAETAMGEAAAMRAPIQIADLAERPNAPLRDASLAVGFRGVLIVPLVGPERVFGALVLQRRATGEFPAETVRLMQTLASQSVLAIQNARLFREIADKSEQLALASEHKSQFLANMSHELRTPLNAILGYAELLVDGIYGVLPEKAQGVLERVQNNGKHLLALINDVLDLAKIEAGQLTLTLEDYNLPELVRTVVTATEPLAAAKGLKFTTSLQEGMPLGHGDARRLSQVLLNLVGNAIKFTDQGEVAINASAGNGQFVLTVRDTGPGIADADQERIFGEFQQIENADTRKKGGTGLGLAISKRMVEMQGGMISVESAPGRGSTFRVVLPVQVEPALEEAAE